MTCTCGDQECEYVQIDDYALCCECALCDFDDYCDTCKELMN